MTSEGLEEMPNISAHVHGQTSDTVNLSSCVDGARGPPLALADIPIVEENQLFEIIF